MKKVLKKVVIAVIGCSLTISMLFGCSPKNKISDCDEITIMAPLNGVSEPQKGNDIENEIKKLTGEDISIKWIPKESYKEKTMMMIAAGEFPDILVVENETEDIVKGVEQGGFWNIGPYLKDYSNLSGADESILNNSSFNGEIYGVYRYRNFIDNAIVLRKDWMKKLGLKNPTTAYEFKEVLKKFTYGDPDGNGVNDTYGLSISGADANEFNSMIEQVAAWFGAPNKWKAENGTLTPSFMTKEYMEALDYIKEIYSEGLIDSKLYSASASDVQKNFVNNKFGAVMGKKSDVLKLQTEISEKYKDNSDIITAIAGVTGNSGGKIFSNSGYSGLLMFPKKGIKTEEKLKRVLSFIDKLNSKEGYILLNYGIEGNNYTIENSNLKRKENTNNYDLLSYSELSTNCKKENILGNGDNGLINELNAVLDVPEDCKAINPAEPLKIQGHVQNQIKLQGEIDELNAKYIFGQINKAEYEQGINNWLNNGGEKYIQKVNDLYKKYLNK